MAERLAFDYSRYTSSKEIEDNVIALDLAALTVEAGKNSLQDRVWPFEYQLKGDKVVCPEMGSQDVKNYFSIETDLDRQETKAGLKIRQALIDQPAGTSIVWLSPPNKTYSEGRITLGRISWQNNQKIMQCYGLAVNFTKKDFINLSQKLSQFDQPSPEINLRSRVFVLPSESFNSWLFIKEVLPLGAIWQSIETKQAEIKKDKVIRDAKMVVSSMPVHLVCQNPISRGAYLERGMEALGHQLSGSSCGLLNKDLVSLSPRRLLNSPHRLVSPESNKKGVYVKECPYCHKKINKIIFPGYKCQCGKAYQGVC